MKDPRRLGTNVRYSEAFRLKILDDIHRGRNTISEVSLLYGIPLQTIYKWIHKYGDERIIARAVRIELKGEVQMVKKLQHENTELKDAISKLTLEYICLKSKLEVYEKHAGISEKKSSFSMPLSAPRKQPKSSG